MLLHFNLVATGLHIGLARLQADGLQFIFPHPGNSLGIQVHTNLLRNIDDIRIFFIDSVTFRLQIHHIAVAFNHLLEAVTGRYGAAVCTVFLTVITTRKCKCTTCMFLFRKTK